MAHSLTLLLAQAGGGSSGFRGGGDDAALERVASPEAVGALLHPGDSARARRASWYAARA